MTQIVVLDGFTENPGDLSWAGLEALGQLRVYPRTKPEEIIPRIGQADIVYTNKTPITRETLLACPSIRMVSVLATGYNVVDVAACQELGILVTNIPTYGTTAVAQFTIALLLEICHQIGHHSQAVHQGRWTSSPDWCFWDYPLMELAGKTLGIIGMGRIGQAVARIAQAMGMEILAYDAHPCDAGLALAEYVPLDALLARSHVISLHCPLFPETQGVINRDTIAKMRDGVILLNTSRGPWWWKRTWPPPFKPARSMPPGWTWYPASPSPRTIPFCKPPIALSPPTSPGPPGKAGSGSWTLRWKTAQPSSGARPRTWYSLNPCAPFPLPLPRTRPAMPWAAFCKPSWHFGFPIGPAQTAGAGHLPQRPKGLYHRPPPCRRPGAGSDRRRPGEAGPTHGLSPIHPIRGPGYPGAQ